MTKKYDIQDRVVKFSIEVIEFLRKVPTSLLISPLIHQLTRSATSVGANLFEADCAETKKDFIHKIGICNKEAKETVYWLRLLAEAFPEAKAKAIALMDEAHEIQLIFVSIIRTAKENEEKKKMSNA